MLGDKLPYVVRYCSFSTKGQQSIIRASVLPIKEFWFYYMLSVTYQSSAHSVPIPHSLHIVVGGRGIVIGRTRRLQLKAEYFSIGRGQYGEEG